MIVDITLKLREAKPLPWSTSSSYISENATHKLATARSLPPVVTLQNWNQVPHFSNLWFSPASARSSVVRRAKDFRLGDLPAAFLREISKAGLKNSQLPLCPCVAAEDGIGAIAPRSPVFPQQTYSSKSSCVVLVTAAPT